MGQYTAKITTRVLSHSVTDDNILFHLRIMFDVAQQVWRATMFLLQVSIIV